MMFLRPITNARSLARACHFSFRYFSKRIPLSSLQMENENALDNDHHIHARNENTNLQSILQTVIKEYPKDISVDDAITDKEFMSSMKKILDAADIDPGKPVIVGIAVSGGRDSMALAILANRWIRKWKKKRPNDRLLSITVDHSLRPESNLEANVVKKWLENLDIEATIEKVDWCDNEKIIRHSTENNDDHDPVQQEARDKRYEIFAKWAASKNVSILLMGHHLQDQIETTIYRL